MRETLIGQLIVQVDGAQIRLRAVTDGAELTLSTSELLDLQQFVGGLNLEAFNRRMAFRVPVPDSTQLVVRLAESGRLLQSRNISYTGMFIVAGDGEVLELLIDEQIALQLHYRGEEVRLEGVVKRRTNEGYGVFFPQSLIEEDLAPDPLIKRVVDELQHRRIMQHIGRSG